MTGVRPILFLTCAAFAVTPWCNGPIALGMGIVLALTGLTAWTKQSKSLSKWLIQLSIVLLGLTIDLHRVQEAGLSGLAFAAGTIIFVFALGFALGRLLGIPNILTTLLCSGTAICGGSAIAATSKVIKADDSDTSIALAAVFVLNAIALFIFPPLGHQLGLNEHQFGTWAAVAIHDMASVVSAGKEYGPIALDQATVVKLTRVLWIVPMAMACAWAFARTPSQREGVGGGLPGSAPAAKSISSLWSALRSALPWFILGFVIASALRTYVPWNRDADDVFKTAAKTGMTLALFLIGCGLSRAALARVGPRPFIMATIVWVALSALSLWAVKAAIV